MDSNQLVDLSNTLAETVKSASRFVVGIQTGGRMPASGVHLRGGLLVTTEHSLPDETRFSIILPNSESGTAEVVGRDPSTDLALLKTEADLPDAVASFSSGALRPGSIVLAVGRSIKNGTTASVGVISLAGEAWNTWRGGKVEHLVRLDIRLHTGASGAAVVDAEGKFIGIATGGLSRSSVVALPAETVMRIVRQLEVSGRMRYGYLGVGLQPVRLPEHLAKDLNLGTDTGLMVLRTEPGSPALLAGITLGDILLGAGSTVFHSHEDLQSVLDGDSVGKTVDFEIVQGGKKLIRSVVVGERPGKQGAERQN